MPQSPHPTSICTHLVHLVGHEHDALVMRELDELAQVVVAQALACGCACACASGQGWGACPVQVCSPRVSLMFGLVASKVCSHQPRMPLPKLQLSLHTGYPHTPLTEHPPVGLPGLMNTRPRTSLPSARASVTLRLSSATDSAHPARSSSR